MFDCIFWDGTHGVVWHVDSYVKEEGKRAESVRHWLSDGDGVGCQIRKRKTIDGLLWLWRYKFMYTFSFYIHAHLYIYIKYIYFLYNATPFVLRAFFASFCRPCHFFFYPSFTKRYNCSANSDFKLKLSC